MKQSHIMCAAILMFAAAPSFVAAQAPAKSAFVDSANKQLQKNGKPAKSKGMTTQALVSQANGKPARAAEVPAITSSSQSAVPAKLARTATDTSKVLPPVQRASRKPKTKPPTK